MGKTYDFSHPRWHDTISLQFLSCALHCKFFKAVILMWSLNSYIQEFRWFLTFSKVSSHNVGDTWPLSRMASSANILPLFWVLFHQHWFPAGLIPGLFDPWGRTPQSENSVPIFHFLFYCNHDKDPGHSAIFFSTVPSSSRMEFPKRDRAMFQLKIISCLIAKYFLKFC